MLNPEKYLEEVEFEKGNHEPRCPCVLLLDTSASMEGEAIEALNEGYKLFLDTLKEDDLAALRVELCVITFGGHVHPLQEFTTVDESSFIKMMSGGLTPMGEAIQLGITKLAERKKLYRSIGVRHFRPWMFLITDGEPTDEWKNAAELVHQHTKGKHLSFFAVGVDDANMAILKNISVRPPVQLKGLQFSEMFEWLSSSLAAASHSNPGDKVQLRTFDSWGAVSL